MVSPRRTCGGRCSDRSLAFFAYFCVSMTFATAENRLFPLYVAAASLAGFALVVVARRILLRRSG